MAEDRKITDIICLLDRSGSMGGLEADTIGGYNAFIRKQASLPGEARITTIIFDDTYEVVHDEVAAHDAILTEKEYFVRGSTALNDAVGRAIIDVKKKTGRAGNVIFVIITDGYENSSVEFSSAMIRNMITEQREAHHWEFLFFGANIEVEAVRDQLGIAEDSARSFTASSDGVTEMLCVMESSVTELRS